MEAILGLMKDEARVLLWWVAVILATLLAFWLTEGTSYHQLVLGVLLSSVSLFVAMAVFEAIWRLIIGRPGKAN